MSYDLFMKPKSEEISIERFQSYFEGRKNYIIDGVQAWYQNEDTGVYFAFEYQEKEEGENDEYFPFAFNMNYFRPTFFVREAEPEIRAFISAFDLTVNDPQTNGMGEGEYNSEKFISGWLFGNEFGYQAVLKDHSGVDSLPSTKLEEIWEWNNKREKRQDEVVDDVFVPSIMLLKHQGKVVTVCIWPDAIPSVIPPVDLLLIGRRELAPRKFFRKVEDMAIGLWGDFQPLFNRHKNKMQGNAYYFYYESVPNDIKKVIQNLASIDLGTLERLPFDQVLNQELVEKYTP